ENATQELETKQIADARQKELKQALDESEARSEALARELASARENDVAARNLAAARERENAAQALEAKKLTDARQKELKQALDESEKRAFALERELTSARKIIASAEKPSNAGEREADPLDGLRADLGDQRGERDRHGAHRVAGVAAEAHALLVRHAVGPVVPRRDDQSDRAGVHVAEHVPADHLVARTDVAA